MASLVPAPGLPLETLPGAPASTLFARRLTAELGLLDDLVLRNPYRLGEVTAVDATLRLTLHGTRARALDGSILETHRLRLEFPRFFPAMPLEAYLDTPVFHPNIHPETGFVCLWDRHSAAHTAEDALHKTVAILGWKLLNLRPQHTMQPAAAALSPAEGDRLRVTLEADPLLGVRGLDLYPTAAPISIRRRLS